MTDLRRAYSLIINLGLIALLGAAWSAARYPSYSSLITIGSLVLSAATSFVILFLTRLHTKLSLTGSEVQNSAPPSDGVEIRDVADPRLRERYSPRTPDVEAWRAILKRWDEYHPAQAIGREMIYRFVQDSLIDRMHVSSTRHSIINIGSVNVIISEGTATIKLGEKTEKVDRSNEPMIDMILRPDLDKRAARDDPRLD